MKALVTGAAGFVGRHMVRELCSRGWEVDGVDVHDHVGNPTVDGGWYRHVTGDVLEAFRADWAVKRYDLVVHAAAAEPHRAAIDSNPMLLAANLELDAAMFRWAVRTRQYRVLYLSSSAAYPVRLQTEEHRQFAGRIVPLRERTINLTQWGKTGDWSPDANYGWTKLTGEGMAAAANDADVQTHIVRPFSGYGEDQSLNFPFPAIVDRARCGDLTVWGPPGQTRDWIHISDVINGALAVVDAGDTRPVNLCTGIGTEMGHLARTVAALASDIPLDAPVTYLEDKPTGVMYRVGDPARMLEHYQPKVTLEEGIARALAR